MRQQNSAFLDTAVTEEPCSRTPPQLPLPPPPLTDSNSSIRPTWNSNELINNVATPAHQFPFFPFIPLALLSLSHVFCDFGSAVRAVEFIRTAGCLSRALSRATFPGRKILHNKFLSLIGARRFTRDAQILRDFGGIRVYLARGTMLIRASIGKPSETFKNDEW